MIFLDTNVVSETMRPTPDRGVIDWLTMHDADLALSSIVIGELAYGIEMIRPDQRSARLAAGLDAWRQRFARRIFGFDEAASLIYGRIMGAARRAGRSMSVPDGMIGAVAIRHGALLATRNALDFEATGLGLIDPWAP